MGTKALRQVIGCYDSELPDPLANEGFTAAWIRIVVSRIKSVYILGYVADRRKPAGLNAFKDLWASGVRIPLTLHLK